MNFSDLGLSPEVLKAVDESGYQTPTPIQEKAIPYVLMGRDILGCAQTGTGKTASFTLPMIDILASGRARARMPRSLIIEPTRELAAQVSENFERYGKFNRLSMALLIGGSSFVDQEKALDRGVDVLIATPGRLLDLFERGKILLADVKVLVIDEADRMLDMGFIPDVERIVSLLPKIRQTLFFSATMPPEIRKLADAFLMNPKEISVSPPASTADTVSQSMVRVGARDKRKALRALLGQDEIRSALIFCNRKRDVDVVNRSLKRHGFSVDCLHGDMVQSKRMETLDGFKNGEVKLLVCSDVAARGLDISEVSHVVNFDVPTHAEDYVHRIGRTGRAGRSGKALTLVTPEEKKYLSAIKRLIGKPIPEIELDGMEAASPRTEPEKEARTGVASSNSRSRRRSAKPSSARGRKVAEAQEAETAVAEAPVAEKAAPKATGAKAGRSKAKADQENTSKPFGKDTPAFLLRPVKLAAGG